MSSFAFDSKFSMPGTECYSYGHPRQCENLISSPQTSATMADVANSLNTSAPSKANSGEIMAPESPDSVLLSPGVKEAMDRIFPRSASQFLSQRLSFDEEPIIGSVPTEGNQNKSSSKVLTLPKTASSTTFSLSHSISSLISTTATTTNGSSVVTVSTSALNGSPVVSLSSVGPHDSPPVTPAGKLSDSKTKETESAVTDICGEQPKLKLAKLRISKADLEIIRATDANDEDSRDRPSRGRGSIDISSSECHSVVETDSEDMCRPFVQAQKEKKKHKKKKRKDSSHKNQLVIKNGMNSGDKFRSSNLGEFEDSSSATTEWNAEDSISLRKIFSKTKKSTSSPKISDDGDRLSKSSSRLDVSSIDGLSQSSIIENGSVSLDSVYRDSETAGEEFSNLSFSSLKENRRKKKSRQKLPKTTRVRFNTHKDKKGIKRFFPPCFVVLEKMNPVSVFHVSKKKKSDDSVLPVPVRVKALSDKCANGLIHCEKRQDFLIEKHCKINFEDSTQPGNSEDEFEKSRGGRSLRKRDKNISYVEPSEDDILVDFAAKHSGLKRKDTGNKSEEEGPSEIKKKKKQEALSAEATVLSPDGQNKQQSPEKSPEKSQTESSDDKVLEDKLSNEKSNEVATEEKKKKKKKHKEKSSPVVSMAAHTIPSSVTAVTSAPVINRTEVVVYPKTKPNEANVYHVRKEGREQLAAKLAEKSQTTEKSKSSSISEKNKKTTPEALSVTRVSVLPTGSPPGSLPRPFIPNSAFTSLPINFPAGLPPPSIIAGVTGTPLSAPVTAGGTLTKPPQYCMVKMDGKDVLLQLVPSGGPGMPGLVPGMNTIILPGGKRFAVPTTSPLLTTASSVLGHPLRPPLSVANSTVQRLSLPVSAVVTSTGHGQMSSSVTLPSVFGIPIVNKSPNTTAHPSTPNISLSALPTMIPVSHLAGPTSGSAFTVPLPLATSVSSLYSSSTAKTTPSVTVLTTAISGASRTVALSIPSTTSGISTASSSMAAPNTTTVVRSVRVPGSNLRAIVPNQSTGVRSVRIFVPGCSATGTPGRFATLGSVATGSPLTRLSASSELLPQRKQSSEQTMTPEQRAAKRRKLEKKYPLPPGVIIKTEPLESPTTTSVTISTGGSGGRSLLTQNLQLISSATRPGTSIRIISPSLASALSARNVRGNSNVIYRAASVGGRQTILVPTSLGLITAHRSSLSVTTATVSVTSTTSAPITTTATLTSTTAVTSRTASLTTSATSAVTVGSESTTSVATASAGDSVTTIVVSSSFPSSTTNSVSMSVGGSPTTCVSTTVGESTTNVVSISESVITCPDVVSAPDSETSSVVASPSAPDSPTVAVTTMVPITAASATNSEERSVPSVVPLIDSEVISRELFSTNDSNPNVTPPEATETLATDIPMSSSNSPSPITVVSTSTTALPTHTSTDVTSGESLETSTSEKDKSDSNDNTKDLPTSANIDSNSTSALTALQEEGASKAITTTSIVSSVSETASSTTPSGPGSSSTAAISLSLPKPTSTLASTPTATDIDNLKLALEGLRKFVQAQEALGLKGERLDKLNELLRKKEEHLEELMKGLEKNTLLASETENGSTENEVSGNGQEVTDEPGGTEADPWIID